MHLNGNPHLNSKPVRTNRSGPDRSVETRLNRQSLVQIQMLSNQCLRQNAIKKSLMWCSSFNWLRSSNHTWYQPANQTCALQVVKFKQKRKSEASYSQKVQESGHNSLETKVENQKITPAFKEMKTCSTGEFWEKGSALIESEADNTKEQKIRPNWRSPRKTESGQQKQSV